MADKAKKIGSITHYYSKLGVGIIKLDNKLKVGDKVSVMSAPRGSKAKQNIGYRIRKI